MAEDKNSRSYDHGHGPEWPRPRTSPRPHPRQPWARQHNTLAMLVQPRPQRQRLRLRRTKSKRRERKNRRKRINKRSRRREKDMPSLRRRLLSAVQKTLEKGEEVANKKHSVVGCTSSGSWCGFSPIVNFIMLWWCQVAGWILAVSLGNEYSAIPTISDQLFRVLSYDGNLNRVCCVFVVGVQTFWKSKYHYFFSKLK